MLTIRRRGRMWHCRGTVRVGQTIRKVKEHSTGCDKREDAETYRANFQHQLQQEIIHGASGRARLMTFADAGLLYLRRPGGLHRNDIWRLEQLNEVLGDEPLTSIKEGWARFKQVRCAGRAPATVDRFRATLQAAINYAAAERSFEAPSVPKVKFKNERVRWLSQVQRERLLTSYAPHVQPIALMYCYQGCRTQEGLQLQWPHVNLSAGKVFFDRTKTGEGRTVALHERVQKALEALHEARGRPSEGHVFLNIRGVPYSDTRDYRLPGGNPLRTAHGTACRRAGITDFRVHDWRHHWASWCVMSGIDLETIRRMGGWKSLEMLQRYAAVSTDHMAEAMRKLA